MLYKQLASLSFTRDSRIAFLRYLSLSPLSWSRLPLHIPPFTLPSPVPRPFSVYKTSLWSYHLLTPHESPQLVVLIAFPTQLPCRLSTPLYIAANNLTITNAKGLLSTSAQLNSTPTTMTTLMNPWYTTPNTQIAGPESGN